MIIWLCWEEHEESTMEKCILKSFPFECREWVHREKFKWCQKEIPQVSTAVVLNIVKLSVILSLFNYFQKGELLFGSAEKSIKSLWWRNASSKVPLLNAANEYYGKIHIMPKRAIMGFYGCSTQYCKTQSHIELIWLFPKGRVIIWLCSEGRVQ